jgi:hypothetical protein
MRALCFKEEKMFRKKYSSSAVDFLERHELELVSECLIHAKNIGDLSQSMEGEWEKKVAEEASFVTSVAQARITLHKAISDMKKGNVEKPKINIEPRYQISSLFLKDCWEYLRSDQMQNERLHLITGTVTEDGTKVLSRIEKIKYDKQSPVYVRADKDDTQQKLLSLTEDFGHMLLGVFHSHISTGALATAPSEIDMSFLKRMEKIGCSCLGGIFSLDGFIRFFKSTDNFEIDVYGKGVKPIQLGSSTKIYKIL